MTPLNIQSFSRLSAALLAATLVLAGCEDSGTQGQFSGQPNQQQNADFTVAPADTPSGAVVDDFAVSFLNSIQAQSIAERREYCGYIFVNTDGLLRATPPRAGTSNRCTVPKPRRNQGIIASYHTHGAYRPESDNEVPSTLDLAADFRHEIDGYVSTPGGRVWLVDYQTRSTRQICGRDCVISDPGFNPRGDSSIRQIYTVPQLQQREES